MAPRRGGGGGGGEWDGSVSVINNFLRVGGIGPMPNPQHGVPGFSVRVATISRLL